MDSSSNNEFKFNEFDEKEEHFDEKEEQFDEKEEQFDEKEEHFDEIENRAEREKYLLPKIYNFNKKETIRYYKWIDDYEVKPGFTMSCYEFIDKINKSRIARNSKRKIIRY